jgi:hypothetical protein
MLLRQYVILWEKNDKVKDDKKERAAKEDIVKECKAGATQQESRNDLSSSCSTAQSHSDLLPFGRTELQLTSFFRSELKKNSDRPNHFGNSFFFVDKFLPPMNWLSLTSFSFVIVWVCTINTVHLFLDHRRVCFFKQFNVLMLLNYKGNLQVWDTWWMHILEYFFS